MLLLLAIILAGVAVYFGFSAWRERGRQRRTFRR
ncbi:MULTISPECIES: small membrane protein [Tatumella]|uniref:Small membrane protein n=1 Tax=Tatumella punctata TaxID=399969 RepID=A0ABW1VRB9_9GAMM